MTHIDDTSHLQGRVQVVNFHPLAQAQLYGPSDAADYKNRSPFPTFHLLREEDIMKAVEQSRYPNIEKIPSRNSVFLRDMGLHEVKRRFDTLVADKSD
eukprot:CAMPEP_0185031068 /NCGR_PEP_ID=MMETSP1103-20130426/18323_1 /TAXON_ID=36769 /ORGANISM="Paraphysomonas bandaiensis, Strain Caron Lab Isolate" /LENGTH=97 /DNA_ID=CAMNT_0027566441 /DNA_START=240 /DNA_END=533 /DNA_ORIENTATION=-